MNLLFHHVPLQESRADALLVSVDENGHVAGSAPARAISAAIDPDLPKDERREELEERHEDIKEASTGLTWGQARVIPGNSPFRWYVVTRAQAHATANETWSPDQHAAVFRDALVGAASAAVEAGASSLATTPMGTVRRVTPELAARALVSGARQVAQLNLEIHVHSLDAEHLAIAEEEWRRAHGSGG